MKKTLSILAIFFGGISNLLSQNPSDILGYWYNQEKTAKIKIFSVVIKEQRYYVGKIVWLKKPNINGKPKIDQRNPDEEKRNRPIMNLNILNDLKWDSEDKKWVDGKVYDPVIGSTYNCYASLVDGNLHLRGYIGISIIGRTAIWTRAKAED